MWLWGLSQLILKKCSERWVAHSRCPLTAGDGGCAAWRETDPLQTHERGWLTVEWLGHASASQISSCGSMCVGGQGAGIAIWWILPLHLLPSAPAQFLLLHLCSYITVSAWWQFPIVFYSLCFSHKTQSPQGVRDCALLIVTCQCQD